jgi:hypothetical protein
VKKTLLIFVGAVLTPVLVVTLLRASGDWHTVGQTQAGDTVSVGAVHKLKAGQRSALVRVQYKEPAEIVQGERLVEMRAIVSLHCADGAAPSATEWFYSRDRNGRVVVSRKISHDDQFGQSSEGGFARLVSDNVCGSSR